MRIAAILFIYCIHSNLFAGIHDDYEQRREAFIQTALSNFNGDAITLQAYKGIPVDQPALTSLLNDIQSSTVADFGIVKLIRILFLAPGTYDAQILPVLQPIPFWLTPNEPNKVYWSENHMIMWMSSDYLLHQKYGWPTDSTLDKRLRHYLHLKVDYGFYEFFSSVYSPYSLSGLLNLADFAEDAEIKSLATQAAQRLLKDMLMLTNDQGTFFPAAGRNYYPKYTSPYGNNHNYLIYLMTGLGHVPNEGSHASNFLASSGIPVDDVINSWTPNLDTIYHIGHTLTQGFVLNQDMPPLDKVIFQWSSGAYFHPDVAFQSAKLIKDYNLWDHSEFIDFQQFSSFPLSLAVPLANLASCISKSSVICGQDVVIYKNKSITLSSIKDFWKGKVGYQQHPCVANVGTTAVFLRSGEEISWEDQPEGHANSTLPYVGQNKNVALIMYRPEKLLPVFGHDNFDVSMHWADADLDETVEDDKWIIGREGNSYVAVRRNCTGVINGFRACSNPDGQSWVIVVGNSDLYGSFDNFKSIIHGAQYEEKWYRQGLNWVYYAKVVVDGKKVEYAWLGDLLSGPSQPTDIFNSKNNLAELNIYPNPVQDELSIDLSAFRNHNAHIRIINILGQEVYAKDLDRIIPDREKINTAGWSNGLYVISIESEGRLGTGKFIIER